MPMALERMPDTDPASPPESVLDRMLKRISSSKEFPSISKYMMEINQKLTGDLNAFHASELANLILNDYALTNKLLKLVNSAFYGMIAGNVSTVTRAVVVLGFENVRMATISLALFDHFKGKNHTEELKEALIGSFWSGVLAREIARMDGLADAEEVFVCAMMSQLGKLLTMYYFPKEYQQIRDWKVAHEGQSDAKAAKAVCGVTYDELGTAVASRWNFPSQISDSMSLLTEDQLRDKKNPPDQIKVITSFVKELQGALQDKGQAPDSLAVQRLLDRYPLSGSLSKRHLETLIKDSAGYIRQHAQAIGIDAGKSAFIERLVSGGPLGPKSSARGDSAQPAGAIPSAFVLADAQDFNAPTHSQVEQAPKDIIMEGIQEISAAMMADNAINDVALMSLEIFYRALHFHRALLFIHEQSSRTMNVRFGYGEQSQTLIRKVGFRLGLGKDLFNLSIQTGKDLIVADARDVQRINLLPLWYRQHIDAPAFIFMPVMFQNVCICAFYADRQADGPPISDAEHRLLGMLRNQLVLAIKFRR